MKRRKKDRKPQASKTMRLVVTREALERAFSRAAFDDNQQGMEAADRLLRLCDEEGHDALVF